MENLYRILQVQMSKVQEFLLLKQFWITSPSKDISTTLRKANLLPSTTRTPTQTISRSIITLTFYLISLAFLEFPFAAIWLVTWRSTTMQTTPGLEIPQATVEEGGTLNGNSCHQNSRKEPLYLESYPFPLPELIHRFIEDYSATLPAL